MRINDLYLMIKDYIANRQQTPPKILDVYDTIRIVKKNNLSVARYGDGEFDLMLNIRKPIKSYATNYGILFLQIIIDFLYAFQMCLWKFLWLD